MDLSVSELIGTVGGKAFLKKHYGNIKGISVDSRTIGEGEVFFALKGEKWDGHNFAREAQTKSRMPVCISEKVLNTEYILVDDTLRALGDVAKYWRKKVGTFIIAITGSAGKTTTKNIIGSILSELYPTYISIRNYNNLIGVPLNIFNLNSKYRYGVLELGTNKKGEIKRLGEICSPALSVITNIGRSHLEFFGNMENILKEKISILDNTEGPVFINMDNPYLSTIKIKNSLTFGFDNTADYAARIIDETIDKTVIEVNGKRFSIPFMGKGNLYNALTAISISLYLKIPQGIIQKGILNTRITRMRLEIKHYNGITVINDAYNANPDSVENALSVLEKFSGRRIAILGDMLELGEYTENLHREVGKFATNRTDILIVVGKDARYIYDEFKGEKYRFGTVQEATNFIKDLLKFGDTILIKGSRRMRMEDIIPGIFQKEEDCSTTYTI